MHGLCIHLHMQHGLCSSVYHLSELTTGSSVHNCTSAQILYVQSLHYFQPQTVYRTVVLNFRLHYLVKFVRLVMCFYMKKLCVCIYVCVNCEFVYVWKCVCVCVWERGREREREREREKKNEISSLALTPLSHQPYQIPSPLLGWVSLFNCPPAMLQPMYSQLKWLFVTVYGHLVLPWIFWIMSKVTYMLWFFFSCF